MRATLSKAGIVALGLASWSAPSIASALGEPAGIAPASGQMEAAPRSLAAIGSQALASLRPVSDDELADARGGFNIGGVNFNFGASVQTLVNGQLALQTNLQWTPAGAVVTQLQGLGTTIQAQVASTLANAGIVVPATSSTGQAPVAASPAAQLASASPATVGTATSASASALTPAVSIAAGPSGVAASLTGGSITLMGGGISPSTPTNTAPNTVVTIPAASASSGAQPAVANSQVAAVASPQTTTPLSNGNAPASSPANNPAVLSGIQIQGPSGSTEVLANVANGQIQNIVLNSASNQNIIQNTNVVLTIYNFASWQQQLAQHAMAAQLASQVLAASGFTGGR